MLFFGAQDIIDLAATSNKCGSTARCACKYVRIVQLPVLTRLLMLYRTHLLASVSKDGTVRRVSTQVVAQAMLTLRFAVGSRLERKH
jgi:hypothetical protein